MEETSREEELQGRLLSAQQALDEGLRERRHSSSKGRSCNSSLGHESKIERFQAVLEQRLHRSAPVIIVGGGVLEPQVTLAMESRRAVSGGATEQAGGQRRCHRRPQGPQGVE